MPKSVVRDSVSNVQVSKYHRSKTRSRTHSQSILQEIDFAPGEMMTN